MSHHQRTRAVDVNRMTIQCSPPGESPAPGPRREFDSARWFLAAWLLLAAWPASHARGGDQAFALPVSGVIAVRTMMPEAGPSSFAVGLGKEFGFCYDPGRGGINYIWSGAFVDLSPTWQGKINKPATIRGEIIYRETGGVPLRLNRPTAAPNYTFRGYAYIPGGIEFHYSIDGIAVREEITPTTDPVGILRRFHLSDRCEEWQLTVPPGSKVFSAEGKWDPAVQAFVGRGTREFSVRIDLGAQAK
jgi:hypothetical protein